MRTTQLLPTLLALSSISTAWPWPPSFDGLKAVQNIDNLIFGRQHNSGSSDKAKPTSSVPTKGEATSAGATPAAQTPNTSNPKSGPKKTDTKGNGKADKTLTSDHASKTTLAPISPVDPAGGVSMISPAITSGAQYYKIGNWITFAWNYTDVLRPPKAVNVLASLSQSNSDGLGANTATFTLTQNMSYQATPTLLWDTDQWATSVTPLAGGEYTLIIYAADVEGGMTAVPKPGYLGLYDQFTFGMYTPAAYTALAPEWQCSTCNAGFSAMERMTLTAVFGMAALTVVSFTWFASGSGILF